VGHVRHAPARRGGQRNARPGGATRAGMREQRDGGAWPRSTGPGCNQQASSEACGRMDRPERAIPGRARLPKGHNRTGEIC
jgi:hypothetical protein